MFRAGDHAERAEQACGGVERFRGEAVQLHEVGLNPIDMDAGGGGFVARHAQHFRRQIDAKDTMPALR
jgi:hypothetical protein